MKRSIAMLLIIGIMLFSLPAISFASDDDVSPTAESAQESSDSVDPGITPDSWLYGLDSFMKNLHLLFTFDIAEKAGLLHDISEERLAEAKKMVDENKEQYSLIAMEAYSDALEKAVEVLDEAIIEEKDVTDVIDEFSSTLSNRMDIIQLIIHQLPEDTKTKINESLEQAINSIVVTINIVKDDELEDEEDFEWDYEIIVTDVITETDEDIADEDTTEDEELDDEETEITNTTGSGITMKLPLKKAVTTEIFKKEITEEAAELYAFGQLNARQIVCVYSFAEQTGKSFEEVLEVFQANGKGIGSTAKALGLAPKNALKAIKGVYKDIKDQIKDDFKATQKDLIEHDTEKITAEYLENILGVELIDKILEINDQNSDQNKDDSDDIDDAQNNEDEDSDDKESVDDNDDDKDEDKDDKDDKKPEKNKVKEKGNKKNDKASSAESQTNKKNDKASFAKSQTNKKNDKASFAKSQTNKKNDNPNARFNRK